MGQHIHIHVIPNSNENKAIVKNQRIVVKIKSKPVKGKANKELVNLLRKLTGRKVIILHGETAQDKVVDIEGLTEQDLKQILQNADSF